MIFTARRVAGWVAISAYLITGAIVYLRVMPNVGWLWPPDFHFLGYDAQSVAPFLDALSGRAEAGYLRVLTVYDRVFIVALAVWMALMGWRGSGLRYVIAGLAVLYGLIDLAENAALVRVVMAESGQANVQGGGLDGIVAAAHHLTMAKFASLYLCALVLIVHLRRTRE